MVCLPFKNMNHSEANDKSFQKKISARFTISKSQNEDWPVFSVGVSVSQYNSGSSMWFNSMTQQSGITLRFGWVEALYKSVNNDLNTYWHQFPSDKICFF